MKPCEPEKHVWVGEDRSFWCRNCGWYGYKVFRKHKNVIPSLTDIGVTRRRDIVEEIKNGTFRNHEVTAQPKDEMQKKEHRRRFTSH